MKKGKLSAILFFVCISQMQAGAMESFRTPAKLYGDAYSIKLILTRGEFEYDIPMWVKPDQKVSSLDRDQILELGWTYKDFKATEASLSGEIIPVPKFVNAKSEWAFLPEFPRRCCHGIIGQDILKNFEVRFDPTPPAHLEWTALPAGTEAKVIAPKKLSSLFSLRSTHYARTPYKLKLSKGELIIEDEKPFLSGLKTARKEPIFRFELSMPGRRLLVTSISSSLVKGAKNLGFRTGFVVKSFNGVQVALLNRFEIEDFLTGKKSKTIDIIGEKSNIGFDFEKNEFIESKSIPSPARRN